MKGFIKLTYRHGETVRFSIAHIVSYLKIEDASFTYMYTVNQDLSESWDIKETPDEIDKLIEEALK